ncbi:cell wall surface anchor family protein [Planoprotostelium fungivorum]|uniref:Cell wall surface anchor family protein n=1 Tax=Planoprotostelium fungivorum TaxID=1890364 RepID=A0A2P6MSV5_9EUKA|nr:cell wall surface anchor family protein [Planoprotostelium fungivorum]
MRGTLSLLLLCIALSQATVYETSVTTIPTTGYFSRIYEANPPAVFLTLIEESYGPNFYTALCDGQFVNGELGFDSVDTCSSYQVIMGTLDNEDFAPTSINLTVIQFADIVQITLGQTYTSENDTSYNFSSDVPYIYSLSTSDSLNYLSNPVGFSGSIFVEANVTLTTTGSVYPLYATTFPHTYSVQVSYFVLSSSFVYEGDTYYGSVFICSSQDAIVLVDQFEAIDYKLLPARSCHSFFEIVQGAYIATVISAATPATLNASTSGNYTAACQTYGNSSSSYALVKLVNDEVTSTGGIINGKTIKSQLAPFDAIFNCGTESSIDLSIQVNGPYTPISLNAQVQSVDFPTGFYQIDVPAGIISDQSSDDPLKLYGGQSCSTETSFNYFGSISRGAFDLCYTVSDNSTFDVPAINSAFIIQPPPGYCIRSDGIPSDASNNVQLNSTNSATFFYEDENTNLFTLTCSADIMSVKLNGMQPMTIHFTLVSISGQGVYGQTYDVNGLLILQYPPFTAPAGIVSVNVTGSAASLTLAVAWEILMWKRTVYTIPFASTSNYLLANTSPLSQFIVMVRGEGQVTTNLGTSDRPSVSYDTSTSSTSFTESSGSDTSSEESTSESSTDSPSTSTVSSSTSTITVQSTSSNSSPVHSSTTSSLVSSKEGDDVTNSSSPDATATTSASVSFTDTSVIHTNNISSDSCVVKASVLSVVVMDESSFYLSIYLLDREFGSRKRATNTLESNHFFNKGGQGESTIDIEKTHLLGAQGTLHFTSSTFFRV